ncbi:homoserine dehydrogenase [Sanguibacter gelidistatuariae]|uniref:Homoserine dehydrogenase n=1 Tax=Sanguibacter gelidistatuariae TaxID=1814289 RepID=A0A1G6VPP1_9MICO|nr:homoserine dehydrogenase [Sanguibacter gelidistatuariae]SDD54825.1 homoserine dehydrogenase [Sanguibacter gelidistatuariae]
MPAPSALRVALLGCGVVGTQVARLLIEQADDLASRVGARLDLVGIAVRDITAPRDAIIDPALLTEDARALVERADIVIEVIGGIEPARTLLLHAIASGASVVTANKALLAEDGPTLYRAADEAGVDVYYEAAVAGAIPIVRPIRESLTGDRIQRVLGIVNGTTNYVLDQMTTHGLAFDEAVAQAQELGYAEADPTADVEGFDAAAKAAILASLAFHTRVTISDVQREGITKITADDVAWAKQTGHVIKLLAICEATEAGVSARVHPALVPLDHPLAGVRGAFNAVFIEAEAAGELMFYGRGAGGAPTASAVLGDVVSVARHRVLGGKGPAESHYAGLPIAAPATSRTRYQMRLAVSDRPGVLAQVAQVVSATGVSIEAVRQVALPDQDSRATSVGSDGSTVALLVITTHHAAESALAQTVAAIADLDAVQDVMSVLRVEGS